jgi:hypothetical protein
MTKAHFPEKMKIVLCVLVLPTVEVSQKAEVNDLVAEILQGVQKRKDIRYDSYFEFKLSLTADDIKEVQKIVESYWRDVKCRLFERYRLQVYWDVSPRRSAFEFLNRIPPIHDIDARWKMLHDD